MKETLLIPIFTGSVDSYANAICYSTRKLGIDNVIFICITGLRSGPDESKASEIYNKVWNRIDSLKSTDNIYQSAHGVQRGFSVISYRRIKADIISLINRYGGRKKCIFDVTGTIKSATTDIFFLAIALEIKEIYSFELKNKIDNSKPSESYLIHNLIEDSDYFYNCLSRTVATNSSKSLIISKNVLYFTTTFLSVVLLTTTLILLFTDSESNKIIQAVSISSAVIGLLSPFISLYFQE